jgi:dolichol-phosphate mannosyltransferase
MTPSWSAGSSRKRAVKKVACIVLPTYMEAKNLPLLLPRIFAQEDKIATHELHVLVVDDNSPDDTQAVVERLRPRYSRLHLLTGEKKGLGVAYQRGMAHALKTFSPDLIFEMDADLQHDPDLLPEFIRLCNEGFSLVIGSRFAHGGATPDFPWHRSFLSHLGNRLARLCGRLPPLRDCTSGYRCIKADLLARCDLHHLGTRGYAFQTSLLCELIRNGARFIEIPITFPDRVYGRSKLSPRDYFEFLLTLAKLGLNSFRKKGNLRQRRTSS